ncbi:helix-turn-helix domain-containing protein [Yinghuangia sp. YIM S10712]|uniref:helix-turn-helix domain-containing protein n=1 Tax=Yinghuangia sp. YIM S10712 TaxID=3436930 RepID=UPI003F5301E0
MSDQTMGQRLYDLRRKRGMSRRELAAAVGISVDTLKSIELGRRQLDRYSLIQSFADALSVDVADLTGRPAHQSGAVGRHGVDAIPAIRRALLRGQLPVRPSDRPTEIGTLRAMVERAHHHRRHGNYGELGLLLPKLLDEAADTAAALDRDEASEAYVLLAEARHDAAMMAKKLGHVDLASVAANLSLAAATASGDTLWITAAAWTQAEVYFTAGAVPEGLQLIQSTLDSIDGMLGNDPGAWSMWGTLHLLAALGTAQWKERQTALAHLAEADRAAAITGERDDCQTVFGPANTALNRLSAHLELGDGVAALRVTDGVDMSVLPKERRARHLIDVGRAYMTAKRDGDAMAALLQASRLSPEYTHAHSMVRDMVTTALNRERMTSREPLRAMARRIGAK